MERKQPVQWSKGIPFPISLENINKLGTDPRGSELIGLAVKMGLDPEHPQYMQPWYEDCMKEENRFNRTKSPCGRLKADCYHCVNRWPEFPCYDPIKKACYNKPEEEEGSQLIDPLSDIYWAVVHIYNIALREMRNLNRVPVSSEEEEKQVKFERGIQQVMNYYGSALGGGYQAGDQARGPNIKYHEELIVDGGIIATGRSILEGIKRKLEEIYGKIIGEQQRRNDLTLRQATNVTRAMVKFKKGERRTRRTRPRRIRDFMAMGMSRHDAELSTDMAMRRQVAEVRHGGKRVRKYKTRRSKKREGRKRKYRRKRKTRK